MQPVCHSPVVFPLAHTVGFASRAKRDNDLGVFGTLLITRLLRLKRTHEKDYSSHPVLIRIAHVY